MKYLISAVMLLCFSTSLHGAGKRILCTTFPIFQFTRNVAYATDTDVELMLPSSMGCPHDYALTPQDMRKLARADILVINGLGLEEFLGAPLEKANKQLKIVNSSEGIPGILEYSGEEHHCETCDTNPSKDYSHETEHEHHHKGMNPHLFGSPAMAAQIVQVIASGLGHLDPENAAKYSENALLYAERLKKIAEDFKTSASQLKNRKIVTQHGVFDYLARDTGIEIAITIQAHPGQEPSAAEMLGTVRKIRKLHAGAIFTEPQYTDKIAQVIAKESGVPLAVLDPCATGPDNAPLSYYEDIMRKNIHTLITVLGK